MNITPQSPYFGSFDAKKNFLRVLYKPEHAVQARELNDAQTAAQYQLGALADQIYKNGSRVSNARSSIIRASYVRLQDNTNAPAPVSVAALVEGDVVTGVASGVRATLIHATDKNTVDPASLFVQYNKTGIDGVQETFVPGEELIITRNDVELLRPLVKCPSCPDAKVGEIYPTGRALFFVIDDGVFYYNSYFVDVHRQMKILSKYYVPDVNVGAVGKTKFFGMKVGLDYTEDYVTASEDSSLLDNSLGYPNEANEGADRLRGRLLLTIRGYNDEDGKNFILLAKVDAEGRTEYLKSDSEYSAIMDEMARRTYETNGNYTIRPFRVSFLNHRRNYVGDAMGWLDNGDASKLVALVSPSVGYVLGYRTETTFEMPVVFPKARDTRRVAGAIMPFTERAYVLMKPGTAIWPNPIDETGMVSTTRVSLWDAPNGTGGQIGSFLVYNMVLHSGTPGTSDAVYRYYFNDLVLASGKTINDVKSATVTVTGFIAAPVLSTSGRFEIKNPLNTSLIYKLPYNNVKTLKTTNPASPGSMILTVRKKFRATLNSAGSATITATTNQSFAALSPSTVGVLTTPANVSTPLPIDTSVLSIAATQVTISAGLANAGSTVTLMLDVLVTNQTQNTKALNDTTFVTAVTPPSTIGSTVGLGVVDVFEIESVKLYDHTNPTPVLIADVTVDWSLDTGVTDYGYTESKVVKKSNEASPFLTAYRLHVKYKAFAHSGNTGFYTVDSYAQLLVPDGNGDVALTYETLPIFTDKSKVSYPLASSIDFRPDLVSGSTIEPVIPANNATAIYEAEFYLPRTDLLQLRKDGTLYVKQGLPSETPRPPKVDEDAMALYHIYLKPYTYSLDDISVKFIENKRFTMRDIGRIEDRVANLEYYTVLSLLEQKTANMSTKDVNGLDRFKNGFLADDFSGFKASDLSHVEFRAAVDASRYELRPSFKARNNKLNPNKTTSSGVKWFGPVAMRDFVLEKAEEQPYATKHLSVNPYFQVARKGRMALSPNVDTWSDDTILPAMTTEIDAGVEALRGVAEAAGVLGTTWGAWSMQNRTIVGQTSSTSRSAGTDVRTWSNGNLRTTETVDIVVDSTATTTTTRSDFVREGVEKSVGSRTQSYTTGEMVRSVQIIPYIRETIIQFVATGMKPNTRVYAFFDNQAVSEFCRNVAVEIDEANVASMRAMLALGAPLYTDETGTIVGEFHMPGGRFFTGAKTFRLTADVNFSAIRSGEGDPDAETTFADAIFFAGGLDVTKQESRLNIITPTFDDQQVSEGRSEFNTTTAVTSAVVSETVVSSVTTVTVPPQRIDPVAQSFVFPEDRFLAAFDVFFQAVDMVNNKIIIEVRSMINGYPSSEVLASKEYLAQNVPVSDDATVPLRVNLDFPVFLRGGTEYCFVVGGWTPDTRIWVAKMGGTDVTFPDKTVETQPSMGSSFRSQNGATWNAEQMEDIKYVLYVARFVEGDMRVVFENTPTGVEKLDANPFETQNGSPRVRVFHRAHGFVEGDKVIVNLVTTPEIEVECSVTPPQPGQKIHSETGNATIKTVTPLTAANRYSLVLDNLSGKFTADQLFTTDNQVPWTDNFLLDTLAGSGRVPPVMIGSHGVVKSSSHAGFASEAINGIPVEAVQREHIVVLVDSVGSYIIDVGTPAGATMRAGGADCSIRDASLRYEVVNVSGSSLAYSSGESWTMTGIGHGRVGSQFAGDDYRQLTPLEFQLASDIHLAQPMKLANANGETTNAVKSLVVEGKFSAFPTNYVSPVLNTDAFSATLITSNVDFETPEQMNVIPNASGRFIAETDPTNGTSPYKYVSATARLAVPAADLRILFDVYKDVTADFDVYVKTLGESDSGTIAERPWVKVVPDVTPDSVDLTDFTEHDLLTSENVPGWTSEPFVAFKIKLVGRTQNSCKPPIFKNLRVIALT